MMPVMSIASQNAAPQKYLGIVSAFTQFFQQVGGVIGIGVIGALFNARLASGLVERLTPDLVEKIQPEKLVDPLFRESLMTDLGPEVWSIAEPQVQTAVATAITDNFLLAAAIVLISVLAIFRMKEIRLRSAALPSGVNVERPDPDPPKTEATRVVEFPILEPKPSSPFNGAVEAFDLELRDQYAPQPMPNRPNGRRWRQVPATRGHDGGDRRSRRWTGVIGRLAAETIELDPALRTVADSRSSSNLTQRLVALVRR